jgi:outer membrane lipoprotein-sorting protein
MQGRKLLIRREQAWIVVATVAAICCGCATRVSTKKNIPAAFRPVALEATREELLEKYNGAAHGVKSINATVELKPTAGSNYSGVIEEYHEVKAFLLAARPAQIRMIGQAPVIGKTIFDMASDGQTFRVAIPSKNKFLVGPVAVERASSKPIENLRPQHLLDALLWPEVRKEEAVLFEEFNDESRRFYVLTVLRGGYQTEILRKIWFDRADLQVARTQSYGPRGVLVSDSHFSDWQPVVGDQEQVAATLSGVTSFPRGIQIERPHDDYRLELAFTKLLLNQEIPADRFKLEQPSGTELVNVGESPEDKPAQKEAKP